MERGIGERLTPPSLLDRLIEDQRLGKKNGRGFYLYPEGTRKTATAACRQGGCLRGSTVGSRISSRAIMPSFR